MPFPTVAAGDIRPSRIVSFSSQPGRVVESSGSGQIFAGVAQEAPRTAFDTLAAKENDAVRVYVSGEICLVETGAAVTAGDRVTSDSQGRAIPLPGTASSSDTSIVGIALQTAPANSRVKVFVSIQYRWPS